MFNNKSEWLKNRIESRNEDYKSFYDNTFIPVLKILDLYELYSQFFNSKLNEETITALDNFFNLLTSSKNNSSIGESIKHSDEGIEEEILVLYFYFYHAYETFCSYNNIIADNFNHYDTIYQHATRFFKKVIIQKISNLDKKLEQLSNQNILDILNRFYSQIDFLLETFTKLIDNYIEIDSYSPVNSELVIQSIEIDESASNFVTKVFPSIVTYFFQTGFYDSDRFKEIKKSIESLKNNGKTKNKKYLDDLGKKEKELYLLIMEKIDELNKRAGFTKEQEKEVNKLIEKKLKEYPMLYNCLKIGKIDEFRKHAYYDEETLQKRYKAASKGINNITICFKDK